MMNSWRRRRSSKKKKPEEVTIPEQFLCPISLELMKDPVTLSSGTTYDRHSIETWIEAGHVTCPVTKQLLHNLEPVPNHSIRKIIQEWCRADRIPTPRVPLTSYQVSDILAQISQTNDQHRCKELVSKMKVSAKECDRNKRCFVSNGAARVLSAAFSRADQNVDVLAEILSAIIMLTPALDEETSRNLSSPPSLQKLVWFLRFGNLSTRRNAVLALRSVVSINDQDKADEVAHIEGALEALVKVIKEPICPTTTKASLLAMYHLLIEPHKATALRLMEMGVVEMLVEMVVDSDRSVCEKALGVLDGMCRFKEVAEKATQNALIIPVLVKKLLRVSEMATEFSVSVLLNVVRTATEEESAAVEALGAGAFQKLLVVLQIGCDEATKEKVTDLLKVFNGYRTTFECVDSQDNFNHLRRPF